MTDRATCVYTVVHLKGTLVKTTYERLSHQHFSSRRRRRLHCRHSRFEICSAFSDTVEEAVHELLKAKAAWLETAKAEGKPIPTPKYRPAIDQIAS